MAVEIIIKSDEHHKQEKTNPNWYDNLFDSVAEQLVINAIRRSFTVPSPMHW